MVVVRLLEETNYIAVLAKDVAEYYAACGVISILDVPLPFKMDAFGIITRKDWLLSPAAKVVLRALKTAAISTYDYVPEAPEPRSAVASSLRVS